MAEEPDGTWNQTSLTSSSSVTETAIGSYMFVMQDYSVAKGIGVGKRITSDKFKVGGHKWAIYFYPNGKRKKKQSTCVSLFIVLKSEATDVRALFEVTLMDRSGGAKHRVVTDFARMLPFTFKRRGSIWGYRRFYNGSSLETSDFLRDDCLKIYITVGVVISTLHSDFSIGSHIGMLLGNIEGSDITFNVSGEKFHAHKLILAARSTKFRSEFLEGMGTEGEEVMVQDIEPNVFKFFDTLQALLHFIYKDALAASELITSASCSAPLVADTLTTKLLAAADRYDLKRLKSICESHLCKDISVDSVAQVFALANLYHASELKDFCLKFAAENPEASTCFEVPFHGGKSERVEPQVMSLMTGNHTAHAFRQINHSGKMADRTPMRSCSVREMGSRSNLFVIQGYSLAKAIGVGNYIASDEFMMGGYKWVLYFYPNGRSAADDNLGFFSVLLSLKGEAEDLPMMFEFTLMDLSGKGKHKVKRSLLESEFRNGGKKWGYTRFFKRAGLETSDFLRDDCLKIYCNMCVADLSAGSKLGMLINNMKSMHEDVFTDDLNPKNWDDLAPKIPASPEIMQDDEDEGEAGEEEALSKLGKELRKLLLSPSNRLNDSDADDEDNNDDMEVDTYSVVVPKKEASKQEPADNSPLKATSSAAGCGTPSGSKSSKLKRKHNGQRSKALNSAPLKIAREENELKRVKDESASSSESGATPPTGPVTEDEIKALLLQGGAPVTTYVIVSRFQLRLKLKEDKDAFAATLRRIAKIEKANGIYYLVPREMI